MKENQKFPTPIITPTTKAEIGEHDAMKKITILLFAISTVILFSCDFLDPEADNTREEEILDESAYICGPLNAVYNSLPTLFDVSMDAMTDNVVDIRGLR